MLTWLISSSSPAEAAPAPLLGGGDGHGGLRGGDVGVAGGPEAGQEGQGSGLGIVAQGTLVALTVGEIHRGGLSIHLRGPSPLIIGQSDGQLWAALGLEGGGKAAGPNIVGAGAPVGQADGELPPLRRGRFKGSVAAVAEGVDAGGQGGGLRLRHNTVGGKGVISGAVHESVLGAGLHVGGVPGAGRHVGKGCGLRRQSGGEEQRCGQSQSEERAFHDNSSFFTENKRDVLAYRLSAGSL